MRTRIRRKCLQPKMALDSCFQTSQTCLESRHRLHLAPKVAIKRCSKPTQFRAQTRNSFIHHLRGNFEYLLRQIRIVSPTYFFRDGYLTFRHEFKLLTWHAFFNASRFWRSSRFNSRLRLKDSAYAKCIPEFIVSTLKKIPSKYHRDWSMILKRY